MSLREVGVEGSPTQYYLPLGFDYTQQDGRRMMYDRGAGSSVQCWNLVAFKKEYIQQNAASVKVGRFIHHFNPLVLKKILLSALDRASKMLLYSIILTGFFFAITDLPWAIFYLLILQDRACPPLHMTAGMNNHWHYSESRICIRPDACYTGGTSVPFHKKTAEFPCSVLGWRL